MNLKQKIVVAIAALAVAYSLSVVTWLTYEPMDSPEGNQLMTKYEHRLFNSPPVNPLAVRPPEIVWMYAFQKVGLVLAINAALLFFLRSKKTKKDPVFTSQATTQAAF